MNVNSTWYAVLASQAFEYLAHSPHSSGLHISEPSSNPFDGVQPFWKLSMRPATS